MYGSLPQRLYSDSMTIVELELPIVYNKCALQDSSVTLVAFRRLSAIMFYLQFLHFLSVIYRWNRNPVFYLLRISEVAYLHCVGIYKVFKVEASQKNEC